jgi:hypothetical protein
MTTQPFISRLNWRLLLIHFLATWFFIHGVQTLSFLNNIQLVYTLQQSDQPPSIEMILEKHFTVTDVTNFSIWTSMSDVIGLLIATIISFIICLKRRWFWVNALIITIVSYILLFFNALGWRYTKDLLLTPGELFNNIKWVFLTNGIFLLAIGLLLFFLPRINRFIEHNKSINYKPQTINDI